MEPISSLSREHLYIPVIGATGLETVEIAFVIPGGEPVTADWKSASWDNITSEGADAKILVGPSGTVTLTDGTYEAWVRVTGSVEKPVLKSGFVVIS